MTDSAPTGIRRGEFYVDLLGQLRLSERDLFGGGNGKALRVCNCACGGQIAADNDDQADITEALRTHQQGVRHANYRLEMGFETAWLQ